MLLKKAGQWLLREDNFTCLNLQKDFISITFKNFTLKLHVQLYDECIFYVEELIEQKIFLYKYNKTRCTFNIIFLSLFFV